MSTDTPSHESSRSRRSVLVVSAFLFFFTGGACALDWSPPGDDLGNFPGDATGSPDKLSDSADVVGVFRTPIAKEYSPDARLRKPPIDCDVDRDGFNDLKKHGCEGAGGLPDCDDTDPRAHPGQGFLEDLTDAGDWNCVNGVERQYPSNVSCGILALGACAGVQGFQGSPRCGEEGAFIECQVAGILCVAAAPTTRRQACK